MMPKEDTRKPVISMLLESTTSEEDYIQGSCETECACNCAQEELTDEEGVHIRLVELPSEPIFDSLGSEDTINWPVCDTANLTTDVQDTDQLFFDHPHMETSSIDKIYAKLYSRTSEIMYSVIYFGKNIYAKCHQAYCYGLVNLSAKYPTLGSWL
ncbi:HFL117Cp [Eremothecium sinecaudum]|uniref:HFL117Cp n=1 Tax=Eremothecium sinecaudum TaxID=45286 RepID=A0A0X8HUJ2_9SACH|nr:HFL117Cp [Eremothecium sinecaudum]AMD21739.1 HFL117Cp [Eremothecium sinecaudum]